MSDNWYAKHASTQYFVPDLMKRHRGVVIDFPEDKSHYIIKPDALGYANVIGSQNNIEAVAGRGLLRGDVVEFSVIPDVSNNSQLIISNVCSCLTKQYISSPVKLIDNCTTQSKVCSGIWFLWRLFSGAQPFAK